MPVTCKLYGTLRDEIEGKSLEREVPEGGSVGAFLDSIADENPGLGERLFEDGDLSESITVSHNGKHVQFKDGLDTALEDGDELGISLPVEGGKR